MPIEKRHIPHAKPKRIAFCITDLDPGGAERALLQIVTRLDSRDWQPAVYCLGPEGLLAEQFRSHGIPVTCYGVRTWWSLLRGLRRFRRDLTEFRPELLQTFLFHGNLAGRWAGRRAGVPVIVAGHRVAEREHLWHLWLERWTRRMVTHHVCVSQGVARHLRERCQVPVDQITVIPNGVSLPVFRRDPHIIREELGLKADCRIVVGVGRLHPQKGFLTLIDAFAVILNQIPQSVHLIIAGEGAQRAELEERIVRRGLSGRVQLIGYRDDIPDLLRASDLFVLSSLWEGMPNVLLEALAVGCPIIATQVEGVGELLDYEIPALVVTPGSIEELGQGMQQILSGDSLSTSSVNESQLNCSKLVTWEKSALGYAALYERLLKTESPVNE